MANAQITSCEEENIDGVEICSLGEYTKKDKEIVDCCYGKKPILVEEKIKVYDITEFNDDDKTITLFISLTTYWNDSRLISR